MATENLLGAIETSPDLILVVDSQTLEIVIQRGSGNALFGYGKRELQGRCASELIPGLTGHRLEALLNGLHDPHPDAPMRATFHSAMGAPVPADLRANAVNSKRAIVIVRRVSEEARVAERELVSIVCSAPAALLTWNREGAIMSFNPGAEALYGARCIEMLGASIELLVPEADRPTFRDICQSAWQGELVASRETRRLRDPLGAKEEFAANERFFCIRDGCGHPVRLGSVSFDATELVRLRRGTEAMAKPAAKIPRQNHVSAMGRVEEAIQLAASDDKINVLLLGETGVGKSWLARRIHSEGKREKGFFLELNCATLTSDLIAAELFGYERGAFTGADTTRIGLVEAASGGTLFLDEVAELPLSVQAKLLSFLDSGQFRRVGGVTNLSSDARIIAATNADLESQVARKEFRSDLYYRLQVLPIVIPPLRERKESILDFSHRILESLRPGNAPDIRPEACTRLIGYDWPGNLRELRNVLERACLYARGDDIAARHLGAGFVEYTQEDSTDDRLRAVVQRHIQQILAKTEGNRTDAARRLGISRSTLKRKLGEFSRENTET